MHSNRPTPVEYDLEAPQCPHATTTIDDFGILVVRETAQESRNYIVSTKPRKSLAWLRSLVREKQLVSFNSVSNFRNIAEAKRGPSCNNVIYHLGIDLKFSSTHNLRHFRAASEVRDT
ncbi:hypothetical protein Mapa_000802 [Marchantia paleacea]|nr:hypothetical protein Mapa_000802 [Marchantia paleacea]